MAVSKVAVVGCGMMGRGIVEVAAAAGLQVTAIKVTPGSLEEPKAKMASAWLMTTIVVIITLMVFKPGA